MREEIGKFFVDIAKLVFGGVVLSTILEIDIKNKIIVLLIGCAVTIAFAILGFIIIKRKKR